MEPEQFRRFKLVSAMLTLGGAAAFVAAGLLGPQGAVKPYMGMPALLSLIPLVYLLLGLWGLIRRGSPKMTIREYAFGLGRMKNTLWGVMTLWGVALAGHGVYMAANRDFSPLELVCCGLEILSLLLLAAQWRAQENVMCTCIHRAESKYDRRDEAACGKAG